MILAVLIRSFERTQAKSCTLQGTLAFHIKFAGEQLLNEQSSLNQLKCDLQVKVPDDSVFHTLLSILISSIKTLPKTASRYENSSISLSVISLKKFRFQFQDKGDEPKTILDLMETI